MQDNLNYLAPVSELSVADRSDFIWKCYAHVVGAILVFAGIEAYLFQSGIAERITAPMLSNWWLVLGAFILVGWGASHVAHRLQSTAAQYAAFAVFVFMEALIFAQCCSSQPPANLALLTAPLALHCSVRSG